MPGRAFTPTHKHRAEISLSHKHEECDRGMTSGVLDQKIKNFTVRGQISAWLLSNHGTVFSNKSLSKNYWNLV